MRCRWNYSSRSRRNHTRSAKELEQGLSLIVVDHISPSDGGVQPSPSVKRHHPSRAMSTQYNAVQRPYDELRKATISIVERVNVREIVLPIIKGAKVLDLACGTGSLTVSP